MALSAYYRESPLEHIVSITMDTKPPPGLGMTLSFGASPYHMWAGVDSATVATLSVEGLPPLSPNVFRVNLNEGMYPPPYLTPEYGGGTSLDMPDGEGTIHAEWGLDWGDTGAVSYASTATKPFGGQKSFSITVVMQLRPLDFLGMGSADNHYNWGGGATVTGVPGVGVIPFITGKAESAATLTFTLTVTLDPPNATFTAG